VVKLATERKHLTDIIKMVAYQAESDLLAWLRPHYTRADQEGRTLLHELSAAVGNISVGENELSVTLAPLSSHGKYHRKPHNIEFSPIFVPVQCPIFRGVPAAVVETKQQRILHAGSSWPAIGVLSRFWDWRAVSPFAGLSGELVITVRRRWNIFSLTPWGLPTGAARQRRGLEAVGNHAIGALASLIPARSWS
jgi:hypothetical protein